MMSGVTEQEKRIIQEQVERGDGDRMLPFPFMGWVECIANTAWDWQFSGLLNNVHTAKNGDFSQARQITHTGALLVGTYDNFTDGDPSEFLRNLNDHLACARRLGIHSLPAYLIQYKDKALLMQSFDYQDFADAINNLIR